MGMRSFNRVTRTTSKLYFCIPALILVFIVTLVLYNIFSQPGSKTCPDNKYGVFVDPERNVCRNVYSRRLELSSEQEQEIKSQRYYIVITLKDNEKILPHLIQQVIKLSQFIGVENVFISILESGSQDLTGLWLNFISEMLTEYVPIQHTIISDKDLVRPPNSNRIAFLARVRNRSMEPFHNHPSKFDKVIFINDILFCYQDILRLILHGVDAACGMDFDISKPPNQQIQFYDRWVSRDIHGQMFEKKSPFFNDPDDVEQMREAQPIQVYCCWNGAVVVKADPFYEGLEFRRGEKGECAASECSLFCKDMWRMNYTRIVLDPEVRVAYHPLIYDNLHPQVPWMMSDPPRIQSTANTHIQHWKGPPKSVYCCGLEGNGRNPDVDCIQEDPI